MSVLLAVVAAYLIGSISFSYLIAKKIKKIDIRQHGSGNAGATNTLRVLGVWPALAVLACDIAKGIVAIWLCHLAGGSGWQIPLAGTAAIFGHNWPVFYGFRGGKGVATTIGVFATLFFLPALFAGILAILLIFLFRYVSVGSLFFIVITPFFSLWIGEHPYSYFYFGCIIAALALWQHRTNLARLLAGEENQIGIRKAGKDG